MALIVVFASILLPYIYYSIKVYSFIHSEDRMDSKNESISPNDPRITHWTDVWVSIVSALV